MANTKAAAKTTEADEATKLKASLRNKAEREVLSRHREELNAVTEGLFKEHGLEYVRRLTPEERAERELEKLLEENPHLRQKLAPVAVSEPVNDTPDEA